MMNIASEIAGQPPVYGQTEEQSSTFWTLLKYAAVGGAIVAAISYFGRPAGEALAGLGESADPNVAEKAAKTVGDAIATGSDKVNAGLDVVQEKAGELKETIAEKMGLAKASPEAAAGNTPPPVTAEAAAPEVPATPAPAVPSTGQAR